MFWRQNTPTNNIKALYTKIMLEAGPENQGKPVQVDQNWKDGMELVHTWHQSSHHILHPL